MKKLLVLLTLGVVLSGCSLLPQKSSEAEVPPLEQQANVNEYQKIAQAMASGEPVECVMFNSQKGTSFTYQVKGKMIRTFGQLTPESTSSGNMISDGTYLYMWSDESAQGTKMKISNETEVSEKTEQPNDVLPDLSDANKQQEFIDLGYSIQCDQKNLSDEIFTPPATVNFQDLSLMMESASQLQAKMASGAGESAPELTQEQIEAMMKSFGADE